MPKFKLQIGRTLMVHYAAVVEVEAADEPEAMDKIEDSFKAGTLAADWISDGESKPQLPSMFMGE